MPPKTTRKKPFSGKKKKAQLQERKARKASKTANPFNVEVAEEKSTHTTSVADHFVLGESLPSASQARPSDRPELVSYFEKQTPAEIQAARLRSMKPFDRLQPDAGLETSASDEPIIPFPTRPTWDYNMTKEELEEHESTYFENWMNETRAKYDATHERCLFESNLEVWRQLWRVLEISDIILLIMDIRHPLIHFPQALYEYVTKTLKRRMIGVFNKVDLVSEFTVFAWRKYFEEKFPELHITTFSCYSRDRTLIDDTKTYVLKTRAKRPKKRTYHAQGVKDILAACAEIAVDKPGLQVDWDQLIHRYDQNYDIQEQETSDDDEESDTDSMVGLDDEFGRIMDITQKEVAPHKGYVTIGLVGHPNVGKSTIINSIMRRVVVSASRTPGHTKHFQTIHLNDVVRLCDSPGLVFPTRLPRALQIVSGMFPVAQVQEPYSVIQYLAERIPLEKILTLTPPDLDNSMSYRWSAWSICEEYAIHRGFLTAQAARPDVYRAANTILRLTNDGRILLSFKPPGFFRSTKYEKLRVAEAVRKEVEEGEREIGNKEYSESKTGTEDDMDEDNDGSKFEIEGGAFAALGDQDG
ncbi:hypothetical protein BCR43DRAFT_523924 [Syncephalastrum racemosum]|uniref:Guanine nucleotide-binding protein-like 1 n=1 Tax=Syncephalastrum racemosum TaxID=13706 RepID=A0A1X2HFW5_SYNRA|nr:hypothetical protein BCR43DRAFT_523924 [Syncephalastrum racemosum]